jgi:hypothetical protein
MARTPRTFGAVKLAKTEGKRHRVAIRDQCREARVKLTEDARLRREALRAAIMAERLALRGRCSVRLTEARENTDKKIEEARKSAMHLDKLRAVTRSPAQQAAAERARLRRAESIKESDDEVRRNLSPDLARIWARVKHTAGMRGGKRISRTERFLQWVHDNSAAVERMLDEEGQRATRAAREETEAEYHQRKADERRSKKRVRQRPIQNLDPQQDLDAIPF